MIDEMNELEQVLYKTRKTILEGCREVDIDIDNAKIINLTECASCGTWHKTKAMIPDLDKNLICSFCYDSYGL